MTTPRPSVWMIRSVLMAGTVPPVEEVRASVLVGAASMASETTTR